LKIVAVSGIIWIVIFLVIAFILLKKPSVNVDNIEKKPKSDGKVKSSKFKARKS
jgi:hypothetical protein